MEKLQNNIPHVENGQESIEGISDDHFREYITSAHENLEEYEPGYFKLVPSLHNALPFLEADAKLSPANRVHSLNSKLHNLEANDVLTIRTVIKNKAEKIRLADKTNMMVGLSYLYARDRIVCERGTTRTDVTEALSLASNLWGENNFSQHIDKLHNKIIRIKDKKRGLVHDTVMDEDENDVNAVILYTDQEKELSIHEMSWKNRGMSPNIDSDFFRFGVNDMAKIFISFRTSVLEGKMDDWDKFSSRDFREAVRFVYAFSSGKANNFISDDINYDPKKFLKDINYAIQEVRRINYKLEEKGKDPNFTLADIFDLRKRIWDKDRKEK